MLPPNALWPWTSPNMVVDLTSLFAVGIPCLAGVVWGVRLEGRINSHDVLFVERDKQQLSNHTDLANRLERIERKLDQATAPTAPIHIIEAPK